MTLDPESLSKQVIVLTGATNDIGLVMARIAARFGAKLVLAARNERALEELTGGTNVAAEIGYMSPPTWQSGGYPASRTNGIDAFVGFDSWVNNAGVSSLTSL